MTSVVAMRHHVEQLRRRHQIAWYHDRKRNDDAYALHDDDEIRAPPTRADILRDRAPYTGGHASALASTAGPLRERWAWL
jgi:hypothetical protein